MNSRHATIHSYNFIFTETHLYTFHIKNFGSWIAKNHDFLQKNSILPPNERLRFHKNLFQTEDTMLPKKYSICLISIFQRDISKMGKIEISEIRNFVLKK